MIPTPDDVVSQYHTGSIQEAHVYISVQRNKERVPPLAVNLLMETHEVVELTHEVVEL